jgi:hypothetical protein
LALSCCRVLRELPPIAVQREAANALIATAFFSKCRNWA